MTEPWAALTYHGRQWKTPSAWPNSPALICLLSSLPQTYYLISTAISQTEALFTSPPESWLSMAVPNLLAHETNMWRLYQIYLLPVPFHYYLWPTRALAARGTEDPVRRWVSRWACSPHLSRPPRDHFISPPQRQASQDGIFCLEYQKSSNDLLKYSAVPANETHLHINMKLEQDYKVFFFLSTVQS